MPPPPCIAFPAVLYCKCNKKTSYGASAPLTGVERQSGANPELSRNSKGEHPAHGESRPLARRQGWEGAHGCSDSKPGDLLVPAFPFGSRCIEP